MLFASFNDFFSSLAISQLISKLNALQTNIQVHVHTDVKMQAHIFYRLYSIFVYLKSGQFLTVKLHLRDQDHTKVNKAKSNLKSILVNLKNC